MRIKNRNKFISFVLYIIPILYLIMITKKIINSHEYSTYYEKSPEIIVEEYNNRHEFFLSSKVVESNTLKLNFLLLSGSTVSGVIDSGDSAVINIKSISKTGNVKVFLWDEKDDTLISKELSDHEEELAIEPGEYQIIIMGKWFTGKVIFNTEDIEYMS